MGPYARKALLGVSFAFLLFILFSALRIGVSQFFLLSANARMDAWEQAGRWPSLNEVISVREHFELSRMLTPADPEAHESLARLSIIHGALPGLVDMERHSALEAGLASAKEAIRLQPVSPYDWAILLAIKRDMGQFDAEFRHALHRFEVLGPWEPALIVEVADIGLSAWDSLPAEEQAIIQQIFVRGLMRQEKLMVDVASGHRSPCVESGVSCQ